MFSPRPFGMSSTKAKSLMKTKRRRVQILDGETSYAKWERIFTSRKHTLMQKACDLEISTGSQVTIVIQTLFGDAWCYASSDDIYQKLLNSEVILRNCIRADNELLYKNYHRQTGGSQQQPWAGFTQANENQQQRGTLSFQETPCSEQSDPDSNVIVNQRGLPTIEGNRDVNECGTEKVGLVNRTNNATAARSYQLSQSESALSNPPVLEHKVSGKSKNQSPSVATAVQNKTTETKKPSANETRILQSKSKSVPPHQRNSNVSKSGTVRAGHVNKTNNNVSALHSKQQSSSQSAMCSPAVSRHKDANRSNNRSSSGNAMENNIMTYETKKSLSNESRKLLPKSKSMPMPSVKTRDQCTQSGSSSGNAMENNIMTYETKKTLSNESRKLPPKSKSMPMPSVKTRDQCTQFDLKVPAKQALQTGNGSTKITSMPVKTDHENRNLTRKREQPHHLLFDDSEEESEVASKHCSSVKHTAIANSTTPARNVSSSSSGSSSTSSSSSSSDSSDSDEETEVQTPLVKDNSCDTLSTVNVLTHTKVPQSNSAVLKASPQLRVPKSEPNCYEPFLLNLSHDAKRQSRSESKNNRSRPIADAPPKPPTPQAVQPATSFQEKSSSNYVDKAITTAEQHWTIVANHGAVVKMEKIATPVKPSNFRRSGSCPPQKHRSRSSTEKKDSNMKHRDQVSKFLPAAGCKGVGGEPTHSVSNKPKHLLTSTPSRKKLKKKAFRNRRSKNNHIPSAGMQPSTVDNKKRSNGKPSNNQNTRKEIIGREGKMYKAGMADGRLHKKQIARPSKLKRQIMRTENNTDHRRQEHGNHKSATPCQQLSESRYLEKNSNPSDANKPKLDARQSFAKSSFSRKSAHSKMDDKSQYNPVTLQNRKRRSSQSSNIHMTDSKRGRRGNPHVAEAFHDPRDFSERYSWQKQTDNTRVLYLNLNEPEHLRPRPKSPAPVTLSPRYSKSHNTRTTTPFYPRSRTDAMSRPDHSIPINQYPSNYSNCNIRQNVNAWTNHRSEVRPLLELPCHPPRHHFIDKGRYFT